ncbi:flavoprotein [Treponema sp.]|uniref:flavoprotein n=1 Tax=Treponema sp. TaxID=166 RepID=UPI00298E54C0|nr:flavoprotein [Treponema sp.]
MSNINKNILIYVSGSISCFKSCSLISLLTKNGYDVRVIASRDALNFVGRASFEGLTHHKIHTDMFNDEFEIPHIELAQRWADLIFAYPASADCINRLANGLADDLFGAVCLANNYKKPLWIAPAMNTNMFLHPSVQESLQKLKSWGTVILESPEGHLACGQDGKGRLLEPQDAFNIIEDYFRQQLVKSAESYSKLCNIGV